MFTNTHPFMTGVDLVSAPLRYEGLTWSPHQQHPLSKVVNEVRKPIEFHRELQDCWFTFTSTLTWVRTVAPSLSFSLWGSSSLLLPLLPPTPPPPFDYFQLRHWCLCACVCVRACHTKRMCQAFAGWRLAGWFGKYLVTINEGRVFLGLIAPPTVPNQTLPQRLTININLDHKRYIKTKTVQ